MPDYARLTAVLNDIAEKYNMSAHDHTRLYEAIIKFKKQNVSEILNIVSKNG
jgi:uncharacterized protein (UPF0147 family)